MELISEAEIYSINMSEDKKKLLLSIAKKGIEVLDIDSLTKIQEFSLNEENVSNLVLTLNNRFLLFSNKNHIITVMDFDKNEKIIEFKYHRNNITSIKVTSDNTKIISSSENGDICICNFFGDLIHTLKGHQAGVTTFTISKDNRFLISGSEDYDIKIWDINSGNLVKTLEYHDYSINQLCTVPSGKYFISSSKEKILFWNLKLNHIIKVIETSNQPLNLLTISLNEEHLLGANDNYIICYDLIKDNLISSQEIQSTPIFLDFCHSNKFFVIGFQSNLIQKIEFEKWLEENKIEFPKIKLPFKAYRGKKPYMFVSYAHLDKETVYKEMLWIKNNGYNIWYDEGIAPTTEWPEEIEIAIQNCTLFIAFITSKAIERENVRNEINYALDKKKPFLAIFLEPTDLKYGLGLRIGSKQAIMKYELDIETYQNKLIETLEGLFK